jgi:hypothetical protein
MRALQELVPHCNKVRKQSLGNYYVRLVVQFDILSDSSVDIPTIVQTDKASILDEAIEYLKSLQMQVQV